MGRKKMEPLVNPLEQAKKMPTFEERYEESLKKKLFEEELKNHQANDDDEDEAEYYEETRNIKHQKRDGEWDVLKDEEIFYFDPELSYELTGYRPITMTEGLDFDPIPFREAALTFEEKGYYTSYLKGSKPYKEYWREQKRRCVEGYTVGKYRVTGDHYFFLNFYRMQTVNTSSDKQVTGRNQGFPSFLSKQYEFFHYMELCEYIGKDVAMLKARGLGFSEILACIGVRPFITTREFTTMYTAFADNQLEPVLDKCWTQLDWLNLNTNGGMKRSRMKVNNAKEKRASLLTPDNIEYGMMSSIKGVIADNPRKVRGSRVERLIFEECFAKDTLVIMSDCSRKKIQDIKIGEYVLGINGEPTKVIGTCNGIDDLYKVNQKFGIDYIVNSKHKLYFEDRYKEPRFVTMTAPEYLSTPITKRRVLYGTSTNGVSGVKDFEINPYYFGIWLGDGYSKNPNKIIINLEKDLEIKNWLVEYFNSIDGGYIEILSEGTCKTYSKQGYARNQNPIINAFKRLNLFGNKHIPREVECSSIEYKLQVLAGIIDTDGNIKSPKVDGGQSFEIEMSRKELILQIKSLAESCGFKVKYSERIRKDDRFKCKETHSYILNIKGELSLIPTKIPRKQIKTKRVQRLHSTGLTIESIGSGEYFGITLESKGDPKTDHLFFLDDYTIVHNCGSNPVLIKSWIQGNALVELGGTKIGVRLCGGTGGDSGPSLEGLSRIFNNPLGYNVLPYKNAYTRDGKIQYTGFFIPAHEFALDPKYLDHRGVTDKIRFREHYEKQRSLMDGNDLLIYCAEHCFTPDEALLRQGDNIFNSELVSQRLTDIRVHKQGIKPKHYVLEWADGERKTKVKPTEVRNSDLVVFEEPKYDINGEVYRNLYVAGIDAIDMGTGDSATDNDVSDFCIVIKKRAFGLESPKYVAMYKARPREIKTAFETAMRLLIWYNAKALIEYTKISFVKHLELNKKSYLLMERPEFAVTTKTRMSRNRKKLIGLPATEAVIKHGLELISMYIEDYWYEIDSEDMLEQMLNYSYEAKRKFDIIAALQCAEIADEELSGVTPTTVNKISKEWRDIGYYIDDWGIKRYGVIPK